MLFNLKRMKKNVKHKAGFRWKCVLISMFILLFTRINNEQSSIISKLVIYLATHKTIYFIKYSELDSFGSSTVPGHLRINIIDFPECQSIPIY